MQPSALIVGAGPSGLSAAEVLAQAGWSVTVVDALGSPARKFLRAGVGGLNLTHSQPLEAFLDAYGPHRARLEPFLRAFGPGQLASWASGLGVKLFTGSSGRVFPEGMGAAPVLGAWLDRLAQLGVNLRTTTRWVGWGSWSEAGRPTVELEGSGGRSPWAADAVVLALGGPTWPALGTGGAWVPLMEARGVAVAPWKPANVGFTVAWTPFFAQKFAGQPLKDVVLSLGNPAVFRRKGELMVTPWGLEGGLLYAAGAGLRETLALGSPAQAVLDLVPGRSAERVLADLSRPRQGRSLATHLHKTLGLNPVKVGLLREVLKPGADDSPEQVASLLKAFPVAFTGTRPLDEAISAAGGVLWDELDGLELKKVRGVWCVGEMLDWEAPTGGYLLTACFSLGRAAGAAIAAGRGSVSRPLS